MIRFEILLPLFYNDGRPIEQEKFLQTDDELVNLFGATSTDTVTVRGRWLYQSTLYQDQLVRVRMDVEDKPETWQSVRACKEVLKARFDQLEACLVLDFLCIHPFRDGNGRVSRLLTVLALYHHGIELGRYISLERLIEESKEDYYAVLQDSSTGWHEGKHDLLPWLNYFLAIVRRAYVQFEGRAGQVKTPKGAKTALVKAAIDAMTGPFTLADLERTCPGVSRDMIRHILRTLQKEGSVECQGHGPAAFWRSKGNTLKKG